MTIWFVGCVSLLLGGYVQHRRLSRLIRSTSSGPEWLQDSANAAAREFKLERVPDVRVVDAVVTPFLWAGAGGPLIVIPLRLLDALKPEDIGLVLKHELAHYVRRDHWSGATVSLACLLLWWNPLVWWIRRETRSLQEACCDQLVLEGNGEARHRYAEVLMATIDLVVGCETPDYHPATAFGDGRILKRRIEMIVNNSIPAMRWQVLSVAVLVASSLLLPLGIALAQDDKAGSRLVEETDQHSQDTSSTSRPKYWNFFWERGASRIDVALFNFGQLLEIHGDGELRGFELAGEDRMFKPATATITSQITKDPDFESNITWINLASAEVKEPRWIRYAEGKYKTRANLVNASGEKALPFNTLPQDASDHEKQEGSSADDSTAVRGEPPYLFWQGFNADSGELLSGQVASPNLEIMKAKLEQLDWSGEASGKPSLGISLDRHLHLRIELAAEKDTKNAMVAILKTPVTLNRRNEVKSGKAVFYNYTRSKPLKDKGHALELLHSYLNNEKGFASLAEWDTCPVSPEVKGEVVSVTMIWDRAPINRDTDIVRFNDRWYVVCCEKSGEFSPDAGLRVISSKDGVHWESTALLKDPIPKMSYRYDPAFTVRPDAKLQVSALGMRKFVWLSDDGRDWSERKRVGHNDVVYSSEVWNKGIALKYAHGSHDGNGSTIQFLSSKNGMNFTPLFEESIEGIPDDAAILFVDDRAHCVMSRQAADPSSRGWEGGRQFQAGLLGTAEAPYTDWKWKNIDAPLCVPKLLRLPDGRTIAAVGLSDKKDSITLCELDLVTGKLKQFLELPVPVKNLSQTAFHRQVAGLAYHDRHLWVSYHATHKGKLCVNLAKVKLSQR